MATTAATLVVKVISDTKGAVSGLDKVSTSTTSWKDKLGKASRVAGAGLLALGGAAIYAGKAAAEDEASQATLANTLKKSAGATDTQVKATEDFIDATAKATGVADDQLRPALGNLVRATGDVEKSQKAMKVALDISAATGADVESVSKAMAKGYAGNEKALNKLLPSVSKTAEKTGDFDKVMQAAAKTTSGAMAASAETSAGKMARMNVSMDEATESLGSALLPAMGLFATVLAVVAGFVQKNSKAVQILVGILAALAAAIVIVNYALKAYAVVTQLIGVVSKATWLGNPIFLVIAAVVLLGLALVVLYKKSKTFRDFINGMWDGIKSAFRTTANLFKTVWKAVLTAVKTAFRAGADVFKTVFKAAFSVVRGYIQAWKEVFRLVINTIKGFVRVFISIFKGDWRGVIDAVKDIIRGFKDFFKSIFDLLPDPVQKVITKIKEGLGGAFDWLKTKVDNILGFVTDLFDDVTDAIGDVIDKVESLIGWIGKIKFPDVGGFLDKVGGIIGKSAPAPAATVASPSVARFAARGVGGRAATTSGGGGGPTIIVQGAIDPEATARQIQRILLGHDRRVGLAGARTP